MGLGIYIESLGCAKNSVDAEMMLGILNQHGYRLTGSKEQADVIIVNTCGFIQSAKEESINKIIELGLLKQNRLKKLIVSGCLGERYHQELLEELPEVDGIVGTGDYRAVIQVVEETLKGNRFAKTGQVDHVFDETLPRIQLNPGPTSYLMIADGCDNFCTYCIIPKLRGKYRSRTMEGILQEARSLAAAGVKELILVAQDTTRYGYDLYGTYRLPELLKALCAIDGLKWIRLLYVYPEMISDELIDVMAAEEKVCAYLDIPVQHASDAILKKMNRRTSQHQLINLVKRLREKMPEVVLRTSLIVGFPGEADHHFQELLAFVEQVRFDKLGVFEYSQEEDTPAARLPDQVPERVKAKRRNAVMALQQQISLEKNQERVGRAMEVLVEERLQSSQDYLCRTQGDAPEIDGVVYVRSEQALLPGDFKQVRITGALEYDLIGEIIDEFGK